MDLRPIFKKNNKKIIDKIRKGTQKYPKNSRYAEKGSKLGEQEFGKRLDQKKGGSHLNRDS